LKASGGSGLPLKTIRELKDEAEKICGVPQSLSLKTKLLLQLRWVDGTVIDVVRKIKAS